MHRKSSCTRDPCVPINTHTKLLAHSYQGQVNHFTRAAPEKIEYAINRFRNETLRVYGVLEIHLSDKYGTNGTAREYLAGNGKGKYSVADVSFFSTSPCYRPLY